MRFFIALSLLLCNLTAFSIHLDRDEVVRGTTAFIELPHQKDVRYLNIRFEKKKFPVFRDPLQKGQYFALLPVSYYESAGEKKIFVSYLNAGEKKESSFELKVLNGTYKHEQIHVSGTKVNPQSPQVKKRVAAEYSEAMRIYNTIEKRSYITQDFILPIESNITSPFGTARVYNGSLKGYHSGTDFRAKTGTPIKAANDGRVVLVKKRFYSGGTVIIDHGEGIYTCYFHLSKFKVKKGTVVKRGELIALSGKSGRVTGPHLHFSARVDGVQVDPLQLMRLLNKNLIKGKQ
jgi:murein DD-endopeptidase MepM/ murein hydrolase activator NlpD